MQIKYNVPKLRHLTSDLSTLTGIGMEFLDVEFNPICHKEEKNGFCSMIQCSGELRSKCSCSDEYILKKCAKSRKLEYHACHAGLCDAAMPVVKNNIIVGYIIMGQIRCSFSEYPFEDKNDPLYKAYKKLPYFTDEQLESLKRLIPYVLFHNAIEIEYDTFLIKVTDYIKSHLSDELNINSICGYFHTSKNSLYKAFRDSYNCTVNEYITDERIKRAKNLLYETGEPVYKVAEMVGIDNYTYFCKLFKKKIGITPTEYKKIEGK